MYTKVIPAWTDNRDKLLQTQSLPEPQRPTGKRKREPKKAPKPTLSEDFVRFWLMRFRKLDVTQQAHRKMLIGTFVNSVYLYDDKLLLTFNYKEGTQTITFDSVQNEAKKASKGSNLDCLTAPEKAAI